MTRIFKKISRFTAGIMTVLFGFNMLCMPVSYAQVSFLPEAGTMVNMTGAYNPVVIKGVQLYPNNPFKFDFIVDTGDTHLSQADLKEQGQKLISYFLASLTTPEKDMWVNLSPYEKDRIIPRTFGDTQMGKELLSQDYLLKQIMATALYPERDLGKQFWQKVYSEAQTKFGTTNVPVSTFNKVWILPDKAVVYENSKTNSVFVVESTLKVMLEQDYLAMKKNMAGTPDTIGTKVIREVVIPALQKEVNEGKNFAPLRQVYQSLILAAWYKKNLRDNVIAKAYIDRNKIKGVDVADKNITQEIYKQYLQAYRKGVYNFIKEDIDPTTQMEVPRKYFSGGENFAMMASLVQNTTDQARVSSAFAGTHLVDIVAGADPAMASSVTAESAGALNTRDEEVFYHLMLLKHASELSDTGEHGQAALAKAGLYADFDRIIQFGQMSPLDKKRLSQLSEGDLETAYLENKTNVVIAAYEWSLSQSNPGGSLLKVMVALGTYHREIARSIEAAGHHLPDSFLARQFASFSRNDLSVEDVLSKVLGIVHTASPAEVAAVEQNLGRHQEAVLPVDPDALEAGVAQIDIKEQLAKAQEAFVDAQKNYDDIAGNVNAPIADKQKAFDELAKEQSAYTTLLEEALPQADTLDKVQALMDHAGPMLKSTQERHPALLQAAKDAGLRQRAALTTLTNGSIVSEENRVEARAAMLDSKIKGGMNSADLQLMFRLEKLNRLLTKEAKEIPKRAVRAAAVPVEVAVPLTVPAGTVKINLADIQARLAAAQRSLKAAKGQYSKTAHDIETVNRQIAIPLLVSAGERKNLAGKLSGLQVALVQADMETEHFQAVVNGIVIEEVNAKAAAVIVEENTPEETSLAVIESQLVQAGRSLKSAQAHYSNVETGFNAINSQIEMWPQAVPVAGKEKLTERLGALRIKKEEADREVVQRQAVYDTLVRRALAAIESQLADAQKALDDAKTQYSNVKEELDGVNTQIEDETMLFSGPAQALLDRKDTLTKELEAASAVVASKQRLYDVFANHTKDARATAVPAEAPAPSPVVLQVNAAEVNLASVEAQAGDAQRALNDAKVHHSNVEAELKRVQSAIQEWRWRFVVPPLASLLAAEQDLLKRMKAASIALAMNQVLYEVRVEQASAAVTPEPAVAAPAPVLTREEEVQAMEKEFIGQLDEVQGLIQQTHAAPQARESYDALGENIPVDASGKKISFDEFIANRSIDVSNLRTRAGSIFDKFVRASHALEAAVKAGETETERQDLQKAFNDADREVEIFKEWADGDFKQVTQGLSDLLKSFLANSSAATQAAPSAPSAGPEVMVNLEELEATISQVEKTSPTLAEIEAFIEALSKEKDFVQRMAEEVDGDMQGAKERYDALEHHMSYTYDEYMDAVYALFADINSRIAQLREALATRHMSADEFQKSYEAALDEQKLLKSDRTVLEHLLQPIPGFLREDHKAGNTNAAEPSRLAGVRSAAVTLIFLALAAAAFIVASVSPVSDITPPKDEMRAPVSIENVIGTNAGRSTVQLQAILAPGSVLKADFSKADEANGASILNTLISSGVLEESTSGQSVHLFNTGAPVSRPQEMQGSNFDGIWNDLLKQPGIHEATGAPVVAPPILVPPVLQPLPGVVAAPAQDNNIIAQVVLGPGQSLNDMVAAAAQDNNLNISPDAVTKIIASGGVTTAKGEVVTQKNIKRFAHQKLVIAFGNSRPVSNAGIEKTLRDYLAAMGQPHSPQDAYRLVQGGYVVYINGVKQSQAKWINHYSGYPTSIKISLPGQADKAMVNGGIDLGQVNVNAQGGGVMTAFNDPEQLKMLLNASGLVPVIYKIQPLTVPMMTMLLGFNVNGAAPDKPHGATMPA